MHVGSALALLGSYLALCAVIARLAVEPLRGRPLWQARSHIALLSLACAIPEAVSPVAVQPDHVRAPAIVEVTLISGLVVVLGLAIAEWLGDGRLMARAGLDQLVGVAAAVVMTLATAGAVLIESLDPVGAPFGHVLSLGLVVACLAHLRWSSAPASLERNPNPRAPLPAAVYAGVSISGAMLALSLVLLGWAGADRAAGSTSEGECPTLAVAVLAAVPELMILWRAVRCARPDVGCAVALGAIILGLSAMAVVDLVDAGRSPYRLREPVTVITVAILSAVLLAALGVRLLNEEHGVGGRSDSR